MPAALLIIKLNALWLTFLYIKTNEAPAAVSAQVKVVAISACSQPLSSKNHCTVFLP